MAPLFDVHLKKIAQVIKRWATVPELPLLFDRSRFSVALGDDDAAQRVAKLARDFLVSGSTIVVAETNFRVGLGRFEKNTPTIIRHFDVIEMGPAFRADIYGGAQPDIFLLKSFRPHVVPPGQKVGQPFLERALKAFVFREVYVVRNAIV